MFGKEQKINYDIEIDNGKEVEARGRTLLLDNFDSFTYNLYQYLAELGSEVEVIRNNVSIEDLVLLSPERLVVSPGPSHPRKAGVSMDAIRYFAGKIPILGVCLGHQAISEVFGGIVAHAGEVKHGKMSKITHDGKGVFADLPNPFNAIRYHSLALKEDAVPSELEVSARAESGVIMGVRHKTLPIEGIQFHPESILTEGGKTILKNFLNMKI